MLKSIDMTFNRFELVLTKPDSVFYPGEELVGSFFISCHEKQIVKCEWLSFAWMYILKATCTDSTCFKFLLTALCIKITGKASLLWFDWKCIPTPYPNWETFLDTDLPVEPASQLGILRAHILFNKNNRKSTVSVKLIMVYFNVSTLQLLLTKRTCLLNTTRSYSPLILIHIVSTIERYNI